MPPDINLTTFLTHYGPIALGWPIALLLWRKVEKLTDDYHNDKIADIEVKAKLEHTLSGLKDIIQGMSNK